MIGTQTLIEVISPSFLLNGGSLNLNIYRTGEQTLPDTSKKEKERFVTFVSLSCIQLLNYHPRLHKYVQSYMLIKSSKQDT